MFYAFQLFEIISKDKTIASYSFKYIYRDECVLLQRDRRCIYHGSQDYGFYYFISDIVEKKRRERERKFARRIMNRAKNKPSESLATWHECCVSWLK